MICESAGHWWVSEGGGLQVCLRCQAGRFIDTTPTEPDPYPDSNLY